jgi:LacI family transcriptional regulator
MARLHAGGPKRFRSSIALVNANSDKLALQRHPTIPIYVDGCRRRAEELGYRIDEFWMREPGFTSERWMKVFKARGIPGGIIVGLMNENRIHQSFLSVVEQMPFVVTGVRTRDPALPFACVDHHMVALHAFEKALQLGYKRLGLVLDESIDALVEHRFTAGYRTGQQLVPFSRRLKLYLFTQKDIPSFAGWLRSQQPDVVFTLYNETQAWIKKASSEYPDKVDLIQYEWRSSNPEISGINQHNDLAGQAAVDMLVGMLHRGERGVPEFSRATLINPTWVDAVK